jgi:hypothetical protein
VKGELHLPPPIIKPIISDFHLSPVSEDEVCEALSKSSSCPGPDRVSFRQLMEVPPGILCNFFKILEFHLRRSEPQILLSFLRKETPNSPQIIGRLPLLQQSCELSIRSLLEDWTPPFKIINLLI